MDKFESITFAVVLLFGLVVGYLSHAILSRYGFDKNSDEIVYISQSELLDLEYKRTRNLPLNKQQLFFGKSEQVIKLIEEIAAKYESPRRRVVYTDNRVSGAQVRSISREVHSLLLKELR